MEKILAEMNHGRWIAICPKCLSEEGIISAMEVKKGDVFICSEEYPNIMATALVPNPRIKGAFNSVPDSVLREETKNQVIADGNAYQVEFPLDAVEIETVLRARPRHARNWSKETTIEELKSENERMLNYA